jgi:hypothetical protein
MTDGNNKKEPEDEFWQNSKNELQIWIKFSKKLRKIFATR